MKLKNGYEIVSPSEDTFHDLKNHIECYEKSACKIIPGNMYHTSVFKDVVANKLQNLEVLPSDIFICSFPRAGSTWTQELTWSIVHNPNLDHKDIQKHSYEKAIFLEIDASLGMIGYPNIVKELFEKYNVETFLDYAKHMESPRIFKTHIFMDFLTEEASEKAKFIYVLRNPLDVCVSWYHLARNLKYLAFKGNLDEFVDRFISGNYHLGSYLEHLKCWDRMKHKSNVLTIQYENLKRDIKGELTKIDEFLGTKLTADQLDKVIQYCSLTEMKKRDPLHQSQETMSAVLKCSKSESVLRKGQIGSSKTELTDEQASKIRKHFRENLGDIKLPYDFSD